MSGSTSAVRIWTNADVLVGETSSTAPNDATTAWTSGEWDPLGLLGEDGLTEAREEEQTDHFAYGGILVRTTKRKHVRTFKFTALENTLIMAELIEPNSTIVVSGGVTHQTVMVPTLVTNVKSFGLQVTDAAITERIYVPRGEVVTVGERIFSDSEMAKRELTVKVYADDDNVLYHRYSNDPSAFAVDSF